MPLEKTEVRKLQAFLRQSFGNDEMRVALNPRNVEDARRASRRAQDRLHQVDDEDGDRSFAFEMKMPVGREALQEYLRMLFENDKLKIVPRAHKTNSSN